MEKDDGIKLKQRKKIKCMKLQTFKKIISAQKSIFLSLTDAKV